MFCVTCLLHSFSKTFLPLLYSKKQVVDVVFEQRVQFWSLSSQKGYMSMGKGIEEGNRRHDIAPLRGKKNNLAGTFQHGKLKALLEVCKISQRGWTRTDALSTRPLQKLKRWGQKQRVSNQTRGRGSSRSAHGLPELLHAACLGTRSWCGLTGRTYKLSEERENRVTKQTTRISANPLIWN